MLDSVIHELSRSEKRTMELFRTWDDDDSGVVTPEEFYRGITALGVTDNLQALSSCRPADIDRLFDRMDRDGNGVLSIVELVGNLKSGGSSSSSSESKAAAGKKEQPVVPKATGAKGEDAAGFIQKRVRGARGPWCPLSRTPAP